VGYLPSVQLPVSQLLWFSIIFLFLLFHHDKKVKKKAPDFSGAFGISSIIDITHSK